MAWRDFFRRGGDEPAEETRATRIENPGVPISSANILEYLGFTSEVASVQVNAENFLTVPAAWAAVDFISGTLADLPLNVYRKKRGADATAELAESDPVNWLISKAPNPEWTSYNWRKHMMGPGVLSRGRAYSYVERAANGKVKALWPLNPDRMLVKRVNGRNRYEYTREDGSKVVYESAEIIDIPWMLGADMVSHAIPYSRHRTTFALGIALQDYAARLFSNGGVPPHQLTGPFTTPAGVENASKDVTQAIRAAAEQGRSVLAIPDGHELKAIGLDLDKSQYVEVRRFVVEEIARIYKLSPVFLQDLSHGTYANTEQQDLNYAKHTVSEWAEEIEQELTLKLFPGARGLRFVKFDLDGLLRGDFKTRTEGHARLVQNAIEKPNEARRIFNLPEADGGDSIHIQQNMTPLGAAGSEPPAQNGGNQDG